MALRQALLVLALFLPALSPGQTPNSINPSRPRPVADTALLLPQVEVREALVRKQAVAVQGESFDSLRRLPFRGLTVSDLLAQDGGVYIKSYGASSSATSSMRGGSAAHTAVLWNGLPLQNPMLGQVDLSLFPVGLFDGIELQYGGRSAAWGSGAIAGLIELENELDPGEGWGGEARLGGGSFGRFHGLGRVAYGGEALGGRTALFFQRAQNDFTYQLRPDLPEQRLPHAAMRQTAILQEATWQPARDQRLNLAIWGQHTDRELPPTTVQNQSLAEQEDAFLRTALNWRIIQEKMIWQFRAGVFREYLDFRDPLASTRAISKHWLGTGEVSGEWFAAPSFRLHFGATYLWTQAEADGYVEAARQHRTAPFLMGRFDWGAWQLQLSMRQEIVDGRPQPFLPGLALEGKLTPWLGLHARVSRNFRVPTLNDLYWSPGGNPDLLPESGWSQEAGAKVHSSWAGWAFRYRLTAYSRRITNWMLWSQPAGQSYFSVSNVTEVWSRGLEQRLTLGRQVGSWQVELHGGFDLQRSTNEVAIERPAMAAGQQLIYTPELLGFASLRVTHARLAFDYRHRWTGAVGTLSGTELDGYTLASLFLTYRQPLAGQELAFFLNVHNLWNTDYRVIEYRPMPGINLETGISWQLGR